VTGAVALLAQESTGANATGINWPLVAGIPSSIAALSGILAYFVGKIRPVAITKAEYQIQGSAPTNRTWLTIFVKNRTYKSEGRTLTSLGLVQVPPLTHRAVHWRWRRKFEDPNSYVLWHQNPSGSVVIAKRDQTKIEAEIRDPKGKPLASADQLPANARVWAAFGSNRAAMKRPRLV
jgi:hypothetical protein